MKNVLTGSILVASGLSFLLSVGLWFLAAEWAGSPEDAKQYGLFVGLWVPSILALGTLLKK